MFTFPVPDGVIGDQLTAELARAGATDIDVAVVDDALVIKADGLDEAAVADVVAAHVPDPPAPPPSIEDTVAAALDASTDFASFKKALIAALQTGNVA